LSFVTDRWMLSRRFCRCPLSWAHSALTCWSQTSCCQVRSSHSAAACRPGQDSLHSVATNPGRQIVGRSFRLRRLPRTRSDGIPRFPHGRKPSGVAVRWGLLDPDHTTAARLPASVVFFRGCVTLGRRLSPRPHLAQHFGPFFHLVGPDPVGQLLDPLDVLHGDPGVGGPPPSSNPKSRSYSHNPSRCYRLPTFLSQFSAYPLTPEAYPSKLTVTTGFAFLLCRPYGP
jgi:hypothetical protein